MDNHQCGKEGSKRGRKELGNRRTARKQQNGMSESLPVNNPLNVSKLDFLIKRHGVAGWIKKQQDKIQL